MLGGLPASNYVLTSRTVNGKALNSNISLTYSDVGAAASSHTHSYLPLSGGTLTGAVNLANGTWNNAGDDCAFGDSNTGGSFSIKGLNANTNLKFVQYRGTNYATITYNGSNLTSSVAFYGAVWNDYAEFRICKEQFMPGQVVFENGDDTLSISNERLQRGCSIISDTFGFAIGETDEAQCPIAVSGRALAYGYESREEFEKHIGWPVCSGPNGTVSIMTEEEEKKYPSRIIGIISAVPKYDTWGTGNIEVNERIWIKVK